MTCRAIRTIKEAEYIVGYRPYLEMLGDLVEGKEVVSSPMGKEVDRAEKAVKLLEDGNVALVSSGDPNVYGMAGLGLEVASREDKLSQVEIVPGVTSFIAASCRAGLSFREAVAVISLSDLLTPWEEIERRVEMALAGGLPLALYNPRSKRRSWQLQRVLDICQDNNPTLEILLAKNISRPGEELRSCTVKELQERADLQEDVNMFSLLIFGGRGMVKGRTAAHSPIHMVGIGPGHLADLTVEAKEVLSRSTCLLGARRYLDQVQALTKGRLISSLGNCPDRMALRMNRAREEVKTGGAPSLLVGGDPSIFGSAWRALQTKDGPGVHLCPGISAFSAVASKAGAPLVGDFLLVSGLKVLHKDGISLPKLQEAGFATVVYNVLATQIQNMILPERAPCVVAKDVGRKGESLTVADAGEMTRRAKEMAGGRFTLILASPRAYIQEGKIITKRGYETRYSY
jgi:precorrin-3B C17-methyltransferase